MLRTLFIDGLKVHDSNGSVDFWLQSPIEGLDAPEYRVNEYDRPGEDGSVVSSMFYSGRPISLPGMVRGASPALFEANRRALAQACAIERDEFGSPVPKRITITTLAGSTYFFDAYFKRPIFQIDQVNWSKFLLQMTVADPFIYDSNQVISAAIMRASGGGFILPVILPITSSGATGGSGIVTNNGNTTTYPILTLTGPLTNPYISNSTNGTSFQLNYTIPGGSVVTIDMREKTIMLNGSSTLLSTKTSDSEWFGLDPGANQINFSTGSSSDSGNLQVSFYNAYLGV